MKFSKKESIGIVEEKTKHFDEPLTLECGEVLDGLKMKYETYGKLDQDKNNAIFICHALTGNHHAAGFYKKHENNPNYGWWEVAIGPNKAIDTNHFFVVCANNLGGCHGTTGPNSINPKTNQEYGDTFPFITVADWVELQLRLMKALGIQKWYAIIGGSLGGMQALQWAISYPKLLNHCVLIASTSKLSTQNIAFNEVVRAAITNNKNIQTHGLKIARMLGHLTYLSSHSLAERFARDKIEGKKHFNLNELQFEIERYLHYQANKFSEEFNPVTYLRLTKALDYFDPAEKYNGDLKKTLSKVEASFFIVSFSSDWRFPPMHSEKIVNSLIANKKKVSYTLVESKAGHDDFLVKNDDFLFVLKTYLISNYNA